MPETERTLVVARTRPEADAWRRANKVRRRDMAVVTPFSHLSVYGFRPTRIVVLPGWDENVHWRNRWEVEHLLVYLARKAGLSSPGLTCDLHEHEDKLLLLARTKRDADTWIRSSRFTARHVEVVTPFSTRSAEGFRATRVVIVPGWDRDVSEQNRGRAVHCAVSAARYAGDAALRDFNEQWNRLCPAG